MSLDLVLLHPPIAEYLERVGYQVRIVNLAVRMLTSNKFE